MTKKITDKMRLNFLIKTGAVISQAYDGHYYLHCANIKENYSSIKYRATPIRAIDAAIKAEMKAKAEVSK